MGDKRFRLEVLPSVLTQNLARLSCYLEWGWGGEGESKLLIKLMWILFKRTPWRDVVLDMKSSFMAVCLHVCLTVCLPGCLSSPYCSHWTLNQSVFTRQALHNLTIPLSRTNTSILPAAVQAHLSELNRQLRDEEITAKGFQRFAAELLSPYIPLLLNATLPDTPRANNTRRENSSRNATSAIVAPVLASPLPVATLTKYGEQARPREEHAKQTRTMMFDGNHAREERHNGAEETEAKNAPVDKSPHNADMKEGWDMARQPRADHTTKVKGAGKDGEQRVTGRKLLSVTNWFDETKTENVISSSKRKVRGLLSVADIGFQGDLSLS